MAATSTAQYAGYANVATDGYPNVRDTSKQVNVHSAQSFIVPYSDPVRNISVSPNQLVHSWQKDNNGNYQCIGRYVSPGRNYTLFESSINDIAPSESLEKILFLLSKLSRADNLFLDMQSQIIRHCVKCLGVVTADGVDMKQKNALLSNKMVNIIHSGTYQVHTHCVGEKTRSVKDYITIGTPMRFTLPTYSEWTDEGYFMHMKHPEDRGKLTMYVEPINVETNMKHLRSSIYTYFWGEPRILSELLLQSIESKEPLHGLYQMLTNMEKMVAAIMVSTMDKAISCGALTMINPRQFHDMFYLVNKKIEETDRTTLTPAQIAEFTPPAGIPPISMDATKILFVIRYLVEQFPNLSAKTGNKSVNRVYNSSGTLSNFNSLDDTDREVLTMLKIFATFIATQYPAKWSNYVNVIRSVQAGSDRINSNSNSVPHLLILKLAYDHPDIDINWVQIPTINDLKFQQNAFNKDDMTRSLECELNEIRQRSDVGDKIFDFRDALMYTTDASKITPTLPFKNTSIYDENHTIGMWGSTTNPFTYDTRKPIDSFKHKALCGQNFAIIFAQLLGLTVPLDPDRTHGHHAEGHMYRVLQSRDAEIVNIIEQATVKCNLMVRTIVRQIMAGLHKGIDIDKELMGYNHATGLNEYSKFWNGSREELDIKTDLGWFENYMKSTGTDLLHAISDYNSQYERRVKGTVTQGGNAGNRALIHIEQ